MLELAALGEATSNCAPLIRPNTLPCPIELGGDFEEGLVQAFAGQSYFPSLEATSVKPATIELAALVQYLVNSTSADATISMDIDGDLEIVMSRFLPAQTPREMLFEIRQLLGSSWEEISDLVGVDRRTIRNWMSGEQIRSNNRDQVAGLLETIRYVDRGNAEKNRALLSSEVGGQTLASFVRSGRFELVMKVAKEGPGRLGRGAPMSKEWRADFGPQSLEIDAVPEVNQITPVKRAPARGNIRRTIRRT